LGGWRDDATETSGGRLEDVSGQLRHGHKVQGVVMEDRPLAGRRRPKGSGGMPALFRAGMGKLSARMATQNPGAPGWPCHPTP